MDKLLDQVNFDLLACRYLDRIDAAVSRKNLTRARVLFNNDTESILDAITGVDLARAINSEEHTILVSKTKRRKRKAA